MNMVPLIIVVLFFGIGIGFWLGFFVLMRKLAARTQAWNRSVGGRLFIAVGTITLVGGIVAAIYSWNFTRVALRTKGAIIGMREQRSRNDGSVLYSPTFQFKSSDGAQHTVDARHFSSPAQFHVGDTIDVLYHAKDPQNAKIDNFFEIWGLATIFGVVGCTHATGGVLYLKWPRILELFYKRRSAKQVD